MKFEMQYMLKQRVVIEADSLEEAAIRARNICDSYGHVLLGVAIPGAWDFTSDNEPPKMPPRNTPPNGTPGSPTLPRLDPLADVVARVARAA